MISQGAGSLEKGPFASNPRPLRVVVTGANGFVGRVVCRRLVAEGHSVISVVRSGSKSSGVAGAIVRIPEFGVDAQWSRVLAGAEAIIHLAARVHQRGHQDANEAELMRSVNCSLTVDLARKAHLAGVKRFIYVSTIKVNGELTVKGVPFKADDSPQPQEPYGISKYEAEQALRTIASESTLETVVIRPTLVYGPGVGANFLSMIRWVRAGIPLPLGAIDNLRSLVSVENLADLINVVLTHPGARNETFLVSDDRDVSTTELLELIARALGKPARLIPIPMGFLRRAAQVIGRTRTADRLCGSLQVDIEKTKAILGWRPPYGLEEELTRTVRSVAN